MKAELIKEIIKVKDYQIHRVFWDIYNHPEAYPADWIKSEGIPYWKWVAKGNKNVAGNPEALIIIKLYKETLKSK